MMAADNPRGAMFRVIVPDQHSRVTNAELFFDLVFVFAVTQVSHTLLHHFTPLGAVQVTVLFLAVWWVWVYTAWVTNWLNPELTPVRILLFAMMLGGLVLSTTIPTAFERRGLWFAIAYATMQLGRTAFWLFATPRHRTAVRHNAIRILTWLSISAVLWIAGGLSEGETRLWLWIAAVTWEYVSPAARFWVPKLGFSSIEAATWPSAALFSSSSRSAKRSSSTARPLPSWNGPRPTSWPSSPRWSAPSRCGGSISTRARRPAPRASRSRPNPAGWRGSPIPICTCRSSPESS
jgi:hypothetical protein